IDEGWKRVPIFQSTIFHLSILKREVAMVHLTSLWLPILLSAVAVFVASSIIHMVLAYHRSDFTKLPDEEGVMAALRKSAVSPGDYVFPKPDSMKAMKDPAFLKRWSEGPVGMMTVMKKAASPSMGKPLALWFLFCIVVSVFAGLVAGSALPSNSPFASVFHFAALTAFVTHGLGLWPTTIWYGRSWMTDRKSTRLN